MKNKKNEIQRKSVAFEIKTVNDDGTFSGYGSTFLGDPDAYGDVILPGAFTKTLAESGTKIALLWQHNPDQPIGVYTNLQEDAKGLAVTGQLNLDVQQGKEAYALLKQGALNGLSIGFQTIRDSYDTETQIRSIIEVKLWEISVVTFPANTNATITSVKTKLERLLDGLTDENCDKTIDFINTLKKSPQDEVAPASAAITNSTEVTQHLDADSNPDAPQDEIELHSLERLSKALTQLKGC